MPETRINVPESIINVHVGFKYVSMIGLIFRIKKKNLYKKKKEHNYTIPIAYDKA